MNLKTLCQSLSGNTESIENDYKLDKSELRFPSVNSILIPKKAEYNLRRYVSKKKLEIIDSDVDIAIEKCLLFLSNLSTTFYTDIKMKSLNSTILHQQTKSASNTYIYTKIIGLLKEGTGKKGAFIEDSNRYQAGNYSKSYRLTDTYLNAGLVEYFIKDERIIQNQTKNFYKQLNKALEHPICSNLIKMYSKIELPSSEELLAIGKRLVKEGHRAKKGKLLTMRNGHKDSYWKDAKKRSFVEDNIKLFEFLTARGFMIPSVGDYKSGGRVVDSFTLMPSWIREQIKINGVNLVECDYTALHPNIALQLYKGDSAFLTHENVGEQTKIDIKAIKIEHLSFFNKHPKQMLKSQLFEFYLEQEPYMLYEIYLDKKKFGYKVTSAKMFKAEVSIMTDVIKHLNSIGINVLYVYDALLGEEKDKAIIIETMNRIILEHGVKTKVKNN